MTDPELSILIDDNAAIVSVDDRFKAIMKWTDIDLFRQPFTYLLPPDAHGRMEKLFAGDTGLFNQILFPRVPLRVKTGGYINFDMRIKQGGESGRWLEFFKPMPHQNTHKNTGPASKANDLQPASDLYSFFNFVERLLESPFEGDVALTMLDITALREDGAGGLSDADKTAVRTEIETTLAAQALGGHVGQFDEASYGLLTSSDFDEDAFEAELKNVAQALNINPDKLGVRRHDMALDDRSLPAKDLHQALNHSKSAFLGELDSGFSLDSLSSVVDGVAHNCNLIREALKKYQYLLSERTVLDNRELISVAVLFEGKVNLEGQIRLPDEIIVMVDHPQLAFDHDMAQLKDLLDKLDKEIDRTDKIQRLHFYGLCRSTLLHDRFLDGLADMLQKAGTPPNQLGFRIQGLPPRKRGGPHWDAIGTLSQIGHPLWLDRFGDAVVDTALLQQLSGGLIEAPAVLMRKLAAHFDGKDLMEKLIATWHGANVKVLAADMPDYAMKELAQSLGIKFSLSDAP